MKQLFFFKRANTIIRYLFLSKLVLLLTAVFIIILSTNNSQAQFDQVLVYNICEGDTVNVPYAPSPPSIYITPGECGLPSPSEESNLPKIYNCRYGQLKITGNEDWICENQSLCFIPQASTEYDIYFPFANDGCCFFDYRVKAIINIECSASESPNEIEGCTNSNAYNYNPDATVDDGSCIFPDETYYMCEGNQVRIGPFKEPPNPPGHCITPGTDFIRDIRPLDGYVSGSDSYYIVSPQETTLYTITTGPPPVAPGQGNCNLPDPITEIVLVEVEVEVEDCEFISTIFKEITICSGDTALLTDFSVPAIGPSNIGQVIPFCTEVGYTIEPYNAIVNHNNNSFEVAPTETTPYLVTIEFVQLDSSSVCMPSGIREEIITVIVEECTPGSTPGSPYIIESCPGELVKLDGFDVDVPSPPSGVFDDVGRPDFRDVDYSIDGPDGNVCKDCTFGFVSPQTTTLYTITWFNDYSDLPKDRVSGTRYFLVEVQDCSTIVDLSATSDFNPKIVSTEGKRNIYLDFYNEGPGYVESVDFVWEINGVIEDTTSYNGPSILADNTLRATLPVYFFEAGVAYTVKITAININGMNDLNSQNNMYEYTIPAFEAAPDLSIEITEPLNPINNGSDNLVVTIFTDGNAYANNFIINWSVNGDLQTPFTVNDAPWNSFSPYGDALSYDIGSVNFNVNNDYKIIAWVELLDDDEDVQLTNNVATFNYSVADRTYYSADKSITICEGDSLTLIPPRVLFDVKCFACRAYFISPVWTLSGDTLNTTSSEITIAPVESGFYNFNTDTSQDCKDRCPDEIDGFTIPPYGPHSYQYGIIVLPCNDNDPSLVGCTDVCAPNYNANALLDDGSCEAYSTCPDDTCFSKYTWDAETCNCEEESIDIDLDCDDNDACTNDYIDTETCDCENEVIADCEYFCTNEPGLMQTSSSFVCGGNTVYMREVFSEVDDNSVKAYVLHEEKSFNGSDYIVMQAGNRFESPGQNYANRPLYISAVIGPPGEDGFPKLEDNCTVWTPKGAYVVFFEPITVTIEDERCQAGLHFVDVSVNGGIGSMSPKYAYTLSTDGNHEYRMVNAGEIKTMGPYGGAGNYTIKVKDAKGCVLDFTNTYSCGALYKVSSTNGRNGSFVITHPNLNAEIKAVDVYSLNGQIVESNATINANFCSVEILGNKGMYLVKLLLSNNEFDYIKVVK